MGLDKIYDSICVKVTCKALNGSGVIVGAISDGITYVITAKHCLIGTKSNPQNIIKDDIKITRNESYGKIEELTVMKYYLHPDENVDLAVIEIEQLPLFKSPEIAVAKYNHKVTMCGYPDELSKYLDNPKEKLFGIITNTTGRIEFRIDPLLTMEKGDKNYLHAFSGSGLFIESDQGHLSLVGIFIEVKHIEVAYRTLISESIEKINQLLEIVESPLLHEPINHAAEWFHREIEYPTKPAVFDNQVNTLSLSYQSSALDIQEDIGKVYEEQLERFVRQRRIGDRKGAMEELRKILIKTERMPVNVAAQFYLKAALWGMEDSTYSKEIEEYHRKAKFLDPLIDDRIFQANKLSLEDDYEQAIKVLQPLDGEAVLISAFNIFLKNDKGAEVEKLLLESKVKLTPLIHQALARCFLQAGSYERATREIEKAMNQDEYMPVHYLIAGYIKYWQGIPSDLQSNRFQIFPPLWVDDIIPTAEQLKHLESAIDFFKIAKNRANLLGATELEHSCRLAIFLTYALLPKHKAWADKEALSILKEDPGNLFAFSYSIYNDLVLNETEHVQPIINAIQRNEANVLLIKSLILYYLNTKKFESALELIEDYKIEFIQNDMSSEWSYLMAQYLSSVGEQETLESFLFNNDGISDSDKTIMRLCMLHNNKIETIHTAKKVVELRGKRIDYYNLARLLYQNNEWGELIDTTKKWIETYPDVRAVELLAEAQSRIQDFTGCLETLENYLQIFPDYELSYHSKSMKIQALQNLGQLEAAIEEADNLWTHAPDEELLMTRSFLYQSLGDIVKVITILKEGIYDGIDSKEVYFYLTKMLVPTFPDEAYRYAIEAMEKYKNEETYLHAISIGFATSHDNEAGELLSKFQVLFPESTQLKLVSVPDLLKMSDAHHERYRANHELYAAGKIPIQLLLVSENSAYGAWFYNLWQTNKDLDQPIKYTFPLLFGGRGHETLKNYQGDCITLEYSACLTAHMLDLFPILIERFSRILISPNLINCIHSDLGKMRSHQPSVNYARQKLRRKLERIQVQEIVLPEIVEKTDDVVIQDAREWEAALEHNAYIVTNQFATDLLHEDKQVPDELQKLQVKIHEVLLSLISIGDLSEEALNGTQFEGLTGRQEVVNKLIEASNPLLVDEVCLDVLAKHDWLEIVTSHFTILIPTDVKKSLQMQQELEERREESIRWLEGLLRILRDLADEEVIEFLPKAPIENDEATPIMLQIVDLLNQTYDAAAAVWIDDRHLNSYVFTGQQSQIVSIIDIIEHLYEKKFLTTPMYIGKLNKLYQSQVQFHVPPAAYVVQLLRQSRVDTHGNILETKQLKSLRYALSAALSKKSLLGKESLHNKPSSEIRLYLAQLNKMINNALREIWQNDQSDELWSISASNWLFTHAHTLPYDVTGLPENENEEFLVQQAAFFQSMLVYHALTFSGNNAALYQQRYLNWLFPVLRQGWESIPNSYKLFLDRIVSIFQDVPVDETQNLNNDQLEIYEYVYLMRLQSLLFNFPEDVFGDVLDKLDTHWIEKIGIKYKKTIRIQSLELEIEHDVWKQWIQHAIDRGNENTYREIYQGYEFEILWHSQQGIINQSLEVRWKKESDRNFTRVNILVPFAQLEHGDESQRLHWLDLAKKYLRITNDELSRYQSSSTFNSELEERLMQSPIYFFERVKFNLEASRNKLPTEEDLFPSQVDIFLTWLHPPKDHTDEEQWLNICISLLAKYDLKEVLSLISSIPISGECGFVGLMKKLIRQGEFEEEQVRLWCIENALKTFNPIQKQQILRYLLQCSNGSNDLEQINLLHVIFTDLLEYEESDQKRAHQEKYNLYLSLLKYADSIMVTSENYTFYSEITRIIWSYLYAGQMLQVFEESNLPVTIPAFSNAMEEYAEKKLNQPILRDVFTKPIECAHPQAVSIWRLVVGGAVEILTTNILPKDLENMLLPSLQKLLLHCINFKLTIPGAHEVFFTFYNCKDSLISGFNQNNVMRLLHLVKKWDAEQDLSEFEFEPVSFANMALQNILSDNELTKESLGYLSLLSQQPLHTGMLQVVAEILNKFRITPDQRGDSLYQRAAILSNLIKALPPVEKNNFTEVYRDDLISLLHLHEEEWQVSIEILATLATSDDVNEACHKFLDLLETVLTKVKKLNTNIYTKQVIDTLLQQMPLIFRGRLKNLQRELS
ncbi:hypothetical protein QFZ77_005171 [Paenibacillus sp. V4I3]|uniref:serine protease n=1 Tax=Paenibacillus sp. V4I3 TaxID=3042305 RepID=UPI00278A6326|nr:serine protease [Paenibacillus sp. V4I3]MDQ0876512.1 hypothetical protein [Paenibacillus sp. V4I3]